MTRRELIQAGLCGAASFLPLRQINLRISDLGPKPLRFAVIADLHHGLAPDALSRFETFLQAVHERKNLDFVIQMGDFCYSQPDSKPVLDLWHGLKLLRLSVLGNHDMDKCDKAEAMLHFGMSRRFYSNVIGGYRFVILDLNNFRKDGKLFPYANGNYFTDGAACNYADPEQFEWLGRELKTSRQPVILISHQPLGFAVPDQKLPAEQVEVLNLIENASNENPKGAVAACLCGHMHVDWLVDQGGMPCYCFNSASYFWYQGMQAYTKPLYAFVEVAGGQMKIEGCIGEFVKAPPKASENVPGRSASIVDRQLDLQESKAHGI